MNLPPAGPTLALLHAPSPNMDRCQLTYLGRSPIQQTRVQQQHSEYAQMLRRSGAEVRVLDVNINLPDAVFIEDTAVVLDEIAVLASMGAESRRAECAGIERELRKYREVHRITSSATVEGGDVLRVGRELLVGVSSRTNAAGVQAFEEIVSHYGYNVVRVPVRQCLHLKTGCTALPDGVLLMNPAWIDVESLHDFDLLTVPGSEPWGANVAVVGSTVCLAADHSRTADMIRERGFTVQTADISEFAKAEGGISCLSILFTQVTT